MSETDEELLAATVQELADVADSHFLPIIKQKAEPARGTEGRSLMVSRPPRGDAT